jgi:YidC/Oxa1 family membrane protein insertase
MHEGPMGVLNGTLEEVSYEDIRTGKQSSNLQSTGGWAGVGDKYWFTAIIPAQSTPIDVQMRYYERNQLPRYQVDVREEPISLASGASVTTEYRIFAGAKEVTLLDQYVRDYQIPLFDRAVDFGLLYFLTKPIFLFLKWIHGHVGNFGIAILLLTVVIRLVLFPLANKSYKAMAHIRELQPRMVALREKYGSDKLKMNQELMELYKREKVSPMSGCLPILVQIPIFFALYKVLYVSIEMRHAPFYGWVHDLSAPDPTSVFNLFGLLPWEAPAFLLIGAWPILMTATMVIQQTLQPAPTDPVQAKVMKFLPYMFLFFFAHFPAGLVIYWTWSNFLSIIQQYIIIRRHGGHKDKSAKKPAAKTQKSGKK